MPSLPWSAQQRAAWSRCRRNALLRSLRSSLVLTPRHRAYPVLDVLCGTAPERKAEQKRCCGE
ncbi:hypothetical protein ACFLW1_02670 [Chloroflexota bacterium]